MYLRGILKIRYKNDGKKQFLRCMAAKYFNTFFGSNLKSALTIFFNYLNFYYYELQYFRIDKN